MSEQRPTSGGTVSSRFAALVAESERVHAELASLLGDGALAEIPSKALPGLATRLVRSADRASAVSTALVGQVAATSGLGIGALVGGTYASPRRWLEVEAGLSRTSATSTLARARDLREHSGDVAHAWLSGEVSSDHVRELTLGISSAMVRMSVPASIRAEVRRQALDTLLPVATQATPADVRKAVERLRILLDPDGATQAQLDAFEDQRLTCQRVGSMSRLTAWLTHDSAAAVMTVVEQYARRIAEADSTAPGAPPQASRSHWPQLLAVAFGEVMTGLLDNAEIGSHHRVAPHLTVTIPIELIATGLTSGLLGEIAIPGHDDTATLPERSARRLLCDSEVTRVVTRRSPTTSTCGRDGAARLLEASHEVLYVGRSERTVTPRMRRALEVRDRHCAFPGCRAPVRRCNAHHVIPWEDGGETSIANLVLLCVRHHHAVHEGGWSVTPHSELSAHTSGCWIFTPPVAAHGAPRCRSRQGRPR